MISPKITKPKIQTSFKDILDNQIDKKESFVISNHAAERLKAKEYKF